MKHTRWFWTRVVITALGGYTGISFTAPESLESSNVGWFDCLLMFLVATLGTLAVIGVQAINPRSARHWRKPSWEINPFHFQEPLQCFHCAAYHFVAAGAVGCATLIWRGASAAPLAVALLSMGAGARLAVELSLHIFRNKTKNAQQLAASEDTGNNDEQMKSGPA